MSDRNPIFKESIEDMLKAQSEHPSTLIDKGRDYDKLKESHTELIIALEVVINELKARGLVKSLPSFENALIKAKSL